MPEAAQLRGIAFVKNSSAQMRSLGLHRPVICDLNQPAHFALSSALLSFELAIASAWDRKI
jgi:hypothetical protein